MTWWRTRCNAPGYKDISFAHRTDWSGDASIEYTVGKEKCTVTIPGAVLNAIIWEGSRNLDEEMAEQEG